jgi:hypothetical protein
MSYIINNSGAFVNIKLTDVGRQKLAQGRLNFTAWGIGDSEINYDREAIVDDNQDDPELSGSSRILRPFDLQPNLKSFITTDGATALQPLTQSQLSTIKAVVNNQATERGFFSANTAHDTFITQTGSTYIKATGVIDNTILSGGTDIVIGTGDTFVVGDLILLKFTNDTVGTLTINTNTTPTPQLWYRIQSTGTTVDIGDTITLDRGLPNLNSTASNTQYIIYHGGEVHDDFGFESTTAYWNTNTLDFESCCDVSCSDVPIWNMNNVWCENLAGMTGSGINDIVSTPNESFEKFGSWEYLGQKYPYLEYLCSGGTTSADIDICDEPGQSSIDGVSKSVSILHYTNNTISNFYGEYLFIDGDNDKTLSLYLPDLMYHRRAFATESGTTMGMNFIATGATQTIGNSQIQYIDLVEDSSQISSDLTPKVVGKVLTQLKTIVIDDDELVAAMSYKSNRNWTLPNLTSNLVAPATGSATGALDSGDAIWMSYTFENSTGTGLTTTLPCQKYTKLINNTSTAKDVQFRLSNIDLLPYMRKEETAYYDGMGFSAREFKVIYQIVSDGSRPAPDAWKVHDFTTSAITATVGETIDPKLLETQNPTAVGFLVDYAKTTGDTTFSIIDSLSMTPNSDTSILQFGDERFFYGNLDTYIGANIYKTVFNLNISADQFKFTSNPTRSSDPQAVVPDIRVTECGIYDSSGDLVMIGKLSKPVKLTSGNTIMLELSIDF